MSRLPSLAPNLFYSFTVDSLHTVLCLPALFKEIWKKEFLGGLTSPALLEPVQTPKYTTGWESLCLCGNPSSPLLWCVSKNNKNIEQCESLMTAEKKRINLCIEWHGFNRRAFTALSSAPKYRKCSFIAPCSMLDQLTASLEQFFKSLK